MYYLAKQTTREELYTTLSSVIDDETNIKIYLYSVCHLVNREKIPYTDFFPLKLLKSNEIELKLDFMGKILNQYYLVEIEEKKEKILKVKTIYDLNFDQLYNLFFTIDNELEYSLYSNNTILSSLSNEYLIKNSNENSNLIRNIKDLRKILIENLKTNKNDEILKIKNIYTRIFELVQKNLKEENTIFDNKIKLEIIKNLKLLKIDCLDRDNILEVLKEVIKKLDEICQMLEVLANYTEEEILNFLNINIFLWKSICRIRKEDIEYILNINYKSIYESLNLDDKFTFKYSLVLKIIYEKIFEYIRYHGGREALKETLNSDLQKKIEYFLNGIQIKNLYLDYYKIFVRYEKKLGYDCLANNRSFFLGNGDPIGGVLPAFRIEKEDIIRLKLKDCSKNISNFCMGNILRLKLFFYYFLIEIAKMYDLELNLNDKKVFTGGRGITEKFKEEFLKKLELEEMLERKLVIYKIFQNFNNYSFFLGNLFEEKKSLEIDHQYFLEVGLKVKKQFKIKNIPGIIVNFSFFHKNPETYLYPDANYVVKTIETGELNIYECLFYKDNFYYFKDVVRKDVLKLHEKDIEVYLLKSVEIDTNQMKYC